jgi:hypothetical protein
MNHYDRRSLDDLANAFPGLSTYAAINEWNQRAKEEQDRINQAIESINEELRAPAQEIADLSVELNRAKSEFKQQPVLKRLFHSNDSEKVLAAQITAIQQGTTSLQTEKSQLLEMSAQLQKITKYAAEFGPKTAAERDLLIKKLRLEKKKLQARKREIGVTATAIRQEARTQSAQAGKRGLFGATGSFGDGSFSDKLAWYDSSLAADQRRSIRYAKESALHPYESAKAEIEQELINLEKRILWIEQFAAGPAAQEPAPAPPEVVYYKTTCPSCGIHIEHTAFSGWVDCPQCRQRVNLAIVDDDGEGEAVR